MGKKVNPWDFGFLPSDFIGNIPPKARKQLTDKVIEKADYLYKKTLDCKLPKSFSKDFMKTAKKNIEKMGNEYEADSLYLNLNYCKPSSLIAPYRDSKLERLCSFFNKETELNAKIIKIKDGKSNKLLPGVKLMAISFSEEMVEELAVNHNTSSGKNLAYHLFNGIMLGYPLGDVISFVSRDEKEMPVLIYKRWAIRESYRIDLDVLIHVPMPYCWPRKWKKKVGIKGEEKLANLYRKYLKKWYKL